MSKREKKITVHLKKTTDNQRIMMQTRYRLAIQVLLVDSRRECQYEYYIL